MKSQQYAIKIENIMRNVFECENGGVGGLVCSDNIRKQPVYSIYCALMYTYCNEKYCKIDNFITKYIYYSDLSIDNILKFASSKMEIDGVQYELGFANGEECIEKIIEDFKEIANC